MRLEFLNASTAAEDYYYKKYPVILNIGEKARYEAITEAFDAGANTTYHTKDEVPTTEGYYLCKNKEGIPFVMYFNEKWTWADDIYAKEYTQDVVPEFWKAI